MDKYTKLWSIVLLSSYVLKVLIKGSALSDALIALGLAAVYVSLEYKAKNKEINELKQELMSFKDDLKIAKEAIDKANNAVTSIKVGQAIKRV